MRLDEVRVSMTNEKGARLKKFVNLCFRGNWKGAGKILTPGNVFAGTGT